MVDKKCDWIFLSGATEHIMYANIVKNKNMEELAQYIRTHVYQLYDHFHFIIERQEQQRFVNEDSTVCVLLDNLRTKYGFAIFDSSKKKEIDRAVKIIEKALTKLSDIELIEDFYTGLIESEGICPDFVSLNSLEGGIATRIK